MIYSKLGGTDIKVSKICLGTMTFGEQNTEQEAHQQLDYSVERGINFIDTAELYPVPANEKTQGLTEKYIGTWLKNRQDRDKLIIATKIAGPNLAFCNHIREKIAYDRRNFTEALNNSLSRLQTDYIDLYQLHWPERKTNFFGTLGYTNHQEEWEDNFLEILHILDSFVKEGKIKYIGLSNETPWGVNNFLQLAKENNLPKIVSVQNPYSLLNRSYEVGMAEISIREKAGLLAYSPLDFGVLSGKYLGGVYPEKARITLFPNYKRYLVERAVQATEAYAKIAKKYDLTLTEMSLSYVNSRQFLTSTIIGATTLNQLKQNIDSVDIVLSKKCLEEIEKVQINNPNPAP